MKGVKNTEELNIKFTEMIPDDNNKFNSPISDFEQIDLFEIFIQNTNKAFKDVMEIRNFISWLYSNKADLLLKNVIAKDSLENLINEFRV